MKEFQLEIDTITGTQVVYVFADDIASAISKAKRTWAEILSVKTIPPGTIKSVEKLGGLSNVPFGC